MKGKQQSERSASCRLREKNPQALGTRKHSFFLTNVLQLISRFWDENLRCSMFGFELDNGRVMATGSSIGYNLDLPTFCRYRISSFFPYERAAAKYSKTKMHMKCGRKMVFPPFYLFLLTCFDNASFVFSVCAFLGCYYFATTILETKKESIRHIAFGDIRS